ncbi:MAG: hypothetical protein WDW38_010414 [Sanguina aurantia]
MGADVTRAFGEHLPKLTHVDILGLGNMQQPWQMSTDHPLPNVTHMRAVNARCHTDILRFIDLFSCPDLTHIEIGQGLFQGNITGHGNHDAQWLMLPPKLRVLRCKALPIGIGCELPDTLNLPFLESITVEEGQRSNPNVCIQVLTELLAAAPSLKMLSLGACMNTIGIQDSCTLVVEQMHSLHQRMLGGLELHGVTLHCSSNYLNVERFDFPGYDTFMPLERVLRNMPRFSSFEACELVALLPNSKAGCLSLLAEVFPDLKMLLLSGPWHDPDVLEEGKLGVFVDLEVLMLYASGLTADAILHLVTCMPNVRELLHMDYPTK